MRHNKYVIGYIALILLLTAASIFSINLFFHEKISHDKLDIHHLPYVIGDWKGRDLPVTEREYQILETRNLISRQYANSHGQNIYLFIVYSETNRSVFHPPEVCLVGTGLTIADKKVERVDGDPYSFLTNRLYAAKGDHKEIVLYSYKAGELYTENFYLQQTYLALHQIFGKRIPGATIRISMPIEDDEKATLAALKRFISQIAKNLDALT